MQIRSDVKHLIPADQVDQYIDEFLTFLANRLDLLSRQCLVFERAVLAEATRDSLETVEDLARLYRSDSSYTLELLEAYPELDQIVSSVAVNCISFAAETAERIHTDLYSVCSAFAKQPRLGAIRLVSSDPHVGGRTVVAFLDSSGEVLAALKPRCLRLEASTTRLLASLCKRDARLENWRLPSYIVKDGYGWCEWIPTKCCETKHEVSAYYFRAGFLLSFSTALGITDLHRDNLISHASSPVAIDLEATFHHRRRPGAPSRHGNTIPEVMEWNVLGTGLLPLWLWKGEDLQGVDLSALGSIGRQYVSIPLQQFVSQNEALEKLVRAGVVLHPGTGAVRLLSEPVRPWQYIPELLEGFEFGCSLTSRSRESISEFVAAHRDSECRFLSRPTAGYHYAIQASLHPLFLRDTDRRIGFLRECLRDDEVTPEWMLTAEVESCRWGDIPCFRSQGSSLSAHDRFYGHSGHLFGTEFEPGADAVLRGLTEPTSPEYLQFNKKLLTGSMLSLQSAHEPSVFSDSGDEPIPTGQPDVLLPDVLVAEQSATDFLVAFVAEQPEPEHWFGFRASAEGGGQYEFGVIGHDFYSGSTGVLYALSSTPKTYWVQTDLRALATTISASVSKKLSSQRDKLGGAYFGTLSAVLPLVATLRRLDDVSTANELVANTREALGQKLAGRDALRHFWGCDLVGGLAGALGVAAVLHRHYPNVDLGEPIARMVRLFAENVKKRVRGAVWEQPALSKSPEIALTGLSHGQVGCALALAEVSALEVDVSSDAAQLSRQFLEWELSQFSPATLNWPDFRFRSTTAEGGEIAWSHGWPGILLAIERINRILPSDALSKFRLKHPPLGFVQALETRRKPSNQSLCHGSIGVYCIAMDLLRLHCHDNGVLKKWADLPRWRSFELRPFRQNAIDPPGCMVGRAGSLLGWNAIRTGAYSTLPMLPHRFLHA